MTNHTGNESPVGLSTDIERRMGVFKSLTDVPGRHRLSNFAAQFEDEDTFDIWAEENVEAEWRADEVRLVESRWKDHMERRGRHHALAEPEDVDLFFGTLLDEMTLRRAHRPYWVELERFYSWLAWHTAYPHRYNPVHMAAAGYQHAARLWEYKVTTVRNQSKRYNE